MATQGGGATLDLRKYLGILRRRLVLSLTVFLMVLALGVGYCIFWPPVYQATCLVVVQPQKVPGDMIRPTVTTRIQERLQIITQQVLSRTRLNEIIKRFNLYPRAQASMPPDELADMMRRNISIKITRKHYFTISFLYNNAKTVAAVTNAVAAFYVDSNMRLREEDAVGTARFLKREMDRLLGQLNDWESRIAKFKQAHLNELPESRKENIDLLEQLRDEHGRLEHSIQGERVRVTSMEFEQGRLHYHLETLKIGRARNLAIGAVSAGGGDEAETKVEPIKNKLNTLLIRYTPNHPDVVKQRLLLEKAQIAEKKRQALLIAEARAKGLSEEDIKKKSKENAEEAAARLTLERLANGIKVGKENMRRFDEEKAKVLALIKETQARIDRAPMVGEKLNDLTRGYKDLQGAYQNLYKKYLEAKMAANLERTQGGEQFEVVDPAQVPDKPYRPNIGRAVPISLLMAIAMALGLAFGLSYIDTSVNSVEQIERDSSLPVLVVIPPLVTRSEKAAKQRRIMMLALIYGSIFLVLMALLALLLTGKAQALKNLIMGIVR